MGRRIVQHSIGEDPDRGKNFTRWRAVAAEDAEGDTPFDDVEDLSLSIDDCVASRQSQGLGCF
jgi:hypothetical protein